MKIPPNKIENFIKKPDNNISGILIYGPDLGLVSLRSEELYKNIKAKNNDIFNAIEFSYKDLKKDPARLNDELRLRSLFGDKKIIKITDIENTITKDLENILKKYSGNNFMLWIGEDLSPSSSVRKLFETEKNLACIPCYKDDIVSLKQLISNYFSQNGYKASYEIIDLLAHKFSGNRLIVISELEKLFTYKGENKQVTLNDIEESISENIELSLDNLCQEFASLNNQGLDNYLNKAFKENISPITIIRTLINYFLKLYLVQVKINNGTPEKIAIDNLKPPIFFKNIPIFKNHLTIWNLDKLSEILLSLQKLEASCKNNNVDPELLLNNNLSLKIYQLQNKQ